MSVIPNGWKVTHLEDCVEILDSQRKPINNTERNARIEGKENNELFPYYGSTGQVGYIDEYIFNEELVALGEDAAPFLDAYKDKAYMLRGKTWVNNHAHVLKGSSGVSNKYLCHYLNQLDYQGHVNGATRLKLTQANMRKMPILVAPSNEQIRIANKLDTLLTKVKDAQTHLEKVPTLLKRFRQSVLAAATSGELTNEWREKELEWKKVLLGDVGEGFNYGSSSKSKPEGDVPVLRMGNIQGGSLDWGKLVYTSDTTEIEKYKLEKGDVLFNRTNSPELVGKTAIYRGEREAIYAGYLIKVKGTDKLNSEFLNLQLNSPGGREYCWRVKTDGVSQSNINAKKLQAFEFMLPSMEEQKEIVRRVESLFTLADTVEKQFQAAKKRLDKLSQSILAKAFRGELVTQNPNDEPAEILLGRIRAQRSIEIISKTKTMKKKSKAKKAIENKARIDNVKPKNRITKPKETVKPKVKSRKVSKPTSGTPIIINDSIFDRYEPYAKELYVLIEDKIGKNLFSLSELLNEIPWPYEQTKKGLFYLLKGDIHNKVTPYAKLEWTNEYMIKLVK